MSEKRKPTVIVYGATSFTGKELLTYLDTHHQNHEFDVILSGRNEQKLKVSAEKLIKKHKIIAAQLDDEQGVKKLIEAGDVVINLAGPFGLHNAEALIRECALTGKHYVDLTGESQWLAQSIVPKYHYLASKTGSCIIPSCGFDSVPSDLSVYLALKTLQEEYADATITKSISFFKVKGTVSGGTVESMKTVANIPAKERLTGEWQLVNVSAHQASTRPRFTYQISSPHLPRPLIGGFFFMWPFNRCIVRRSWALSQHNPDLIASKALEKDEKAGKEPVHGEKFVYEESHETGSKLGALLLTGSIMLFGVLFFGSRLTRWLVLKLLPSAGQGQDMEKLKKGRMAVTNVSETTIPDVQVITTCKAEGDPGYIVTNYMIAESALSLILPPPSGTSLPPLSQIGGVLTPSTGLGSVLIQRLRDSGKMEWESRVAKGSRAKTD